jgi:hypothetical protein
MRRKRVKRVKRSTLNGATASLLPSCAEGLFATFPAPLRRLDVLETLMAVEATYNARSRIRGRVGGLLNLRLSSFRSRPRPGRDVSSIWHLQ